MKAFRIALCLVAILIAGTFAQIGYEIYEQRKVCYRFGHTEHTTAALTDDAHYEITTICIICGKKTVEKGGLK